MTKPENRLQSHYDSAPAKHDSSIPAMQGFDAEFTDIVDYILRITYRIWEGKQIGLCYDYYSHDCPVYTLAGYVEGAEEVVQNTLNTIAAFPDRVLEADNIIWGGDDQEGFHSSHLINTRMTNLGDSEFGASTGKQGEIKVIAHCICKDNKIIEEWLVRDNYSLAEQLGFNPQELAIKYASRPVEQRFDQWRKNEIIRVSDNVIRDRLSHSKDHSATEFILSTLQNLWNATMLGDVFTTYAVNASINASARENITGHADIVRFYTGFLGTFSNLKVSFDYACEQPSEQGGVDVAVRWSMVGDHTGRHLFGEPTGSTVLVIGESHYRVKKNLIQEEVTVFDQIAIMTQIERARLMNQLANECKDPEE